MTRKTHRPVTERESAIIRALAGIKLPWSSQMHFLVRGLLFMIDHMPEPIITEGQAQKLTIAAWRYRRLIPAHLAYPMTEDERETA